jgi:hypothetical protein
MKARLWLNEGLRLVVLLFLPFALCLLSLPLSARAQKPPDFRELGLGQPSPDNMLCGIYDHAHLWHWFKCGDPAHAGVDDRTLHLMGMDWAGRRIPKGMSEKKYWFVSLASVALTVADVETTQACIRAHTCREGNPLMGQTRAQEYAVSLTVPLIGLWYQRKFYDEDHVRKRFGIVKRREFAWWSVPLTVSVWHTMGLWSGLSARR